MEQRPAIPIWIADLLSGSFNQQDDGPSTLTLQNGIAIEKARIYGIVVSTNELVVDDGTGSILVRTFDKSFTVTVGDIVLVIGRPRQYNQQPYFLGEIIKKIDAKWLEIRKKQNPLPAGGGKEAALNTVKSLDTGEGADYNEVVSRLGGKEDLIIHLLAVGELFETKPGKLKILE